MDCKQDAEDEAELKSLLTNASISLCSNASELHCFPGHSKCFSIQDICSYKLDDIGYLRPCRNGGHLQSCSAFNCVHNFKCDFAYCLPWKYVCDGLWNCPGGEDEKFARICGNKSVCIGMFKCRNAPHKCLHIGNVCDGNVDCPIGDDENLCQQCPHNCKCLALAALCNDQDMHLTENTYRHLFLSVTVNIVPFAKFFTHFEDLLILKASTNNISDVCLLILPKKLVHLEVIHNDFPNIKGQCFKALYNLRIIALKTNRIQSTEARSFSDLQQLKNIDLSDNQISQIPNVLTTACPVLKLISVAKNTFRDFSGFQYLGIEIVVADDFTICCVVPSNTTCTASKLWFMSCGDIMPQKAMKVWWGIVSFYIVISSGVCLVAHVYTQRTGKAFSATVVCVNICDLLCAIYLLTIWSIDLKYQGTFPKHEKVWRSSFGCFAASCLFLWFSELTQTVQLFMALSRLMVVVQPVDSQFKRAGFVCKCLAVIIICTFVIGIILTVLTVALDKALPTALCLLSVDPTDSSVLTKIVVWLISIAQSLLVVATMSTHIGLVYNLLESQKKIQSSKTKESNTTIYVQLVSMTISNVLCCFTANSVFLSAMFLETFSTEMIIWTNASFVPLNSIILPIVFLVCIRKQLAGKTKQIHG